MEKRWPISVGLKPGRTESWSRQGEAGRCATTENLRIEPALKTAELRESKQRPDERIWASGPSRA